MKIVRYADKKKAWEIRRKRIMAMRSRGLAMADIARKEGITPQRVKQICDKECNHEPKTGREASAENQSAGNEI